MIPSLSTSTTFRAVASVRALSRSTRNLETRALLIRVERQILAMASCLHQP